MLKFFCKWFSRLDSDALAQYRMLFPEPATWKGWYTWEHNQEFLKHNSYRIIAWQPGGTPKYSLDSLAADFCKQQKLKLCLFEDPQPSVNSTIDNSCFSQWWRAKFYYEYDYFYSEQFMMEAKARLFSDYNIACEIRKSTDPKWLGFLGCRVGVFGWVIWGEFGLIPFSVFSCFLRRLYYCLCRPDGSDLGNRFEC